ncbi:serine/threonine protein kinase [Alicyclobacillus hesperidum]|uniref:Serine/threonine protein kinase n=1 Tax=Alicyclobacillus hesperidum TaxID=89784 RepID=A0A1H2TN85_9BACL|nr:phosphotransferase [Alicyclobacillus hesperidum]SDW44709.1 serine/threonine protein kinase [Alicyclobacillus hesperidum]
MSDKSQKQIPSGTWIHGKWTGRRWRVRGCLGVGANGVVYAVDRDDGLPGAMKVCAGAGQVAFEWSLLERVKGARSPFPAPQQIDDSDHPLAQYFYVMERVGGKSLDQVWSGLTPADRQRVLLDIVAGLVQLHETGYAFCDVKAQNILVDVSDDMRVRFVDAGGVTPFGKAVRQFTPTSDGAFWGVCERRACAQYDLVGVALMALLLDVKPPANLSSQSQEQRRAWLNKAIVQAPGACWQSILQKVLRGSVTDATTFAMLLHSIPLPKDPERPDWSARLMWGSLASATLSTACAWALYLRLI